MSKSVPKKTQVNPFHRHPATERGPTNTSQAQNCRPFSSQMYTKRKRHGRIAPGSTARIDMPSPLCVGTKDGGGPDGGPPCCPGGPKGGVPDGGPKGGTPGGGPKGGPSCLSGGPGCLGGLSRNGLNLLIGNCAWNLSGIVSPPSSELVLYHMASSWFWAQGYLSNMPFIYGDICAFFRLNCMQRICPTQRGLLSTVPLNTGCFLQLSLQVFRG